MSRELELHLTEEELDDLLIGESTEASEGHIENCPACRLKVEEFRATMAMVDESSMAWSRVRAAGMPNPVLHTGAQRFALATIGAAAVCVLTAVVAIPIWHGLERPAQRAQMPAHLQQQQTAPAAAQGTKNEDSEAQIAADNQLLQEVDRALNASEASPLEEFTGSGRPQAKARRQ